MISRAQLGELTRVHVMGDRDEVLLGLSSGNVRIALIMAEPCARAVYTELHQVLPAAEPVTRRPKAPQTKEFQVNWRAIVGRLRAGKPAPSDADAVAHLLEYLGATTT